MIFVKKRREKIQILFGWKMCLINSYASEEVTFGDMTDMPSPMFKGKIQIL